MTTGKQNKEGKVKSKDWRRGQCTGSLLILELYVFEIA